MDKKIKEPPVMSLNFPKDGKVQPSGFAGLGVDEDITIVIKGKVVRIEENAESCTGRNAHVAHQLDQLRPGRRDALLGAGQWDPGKNLRVKISKCDIHGPEKKVTLDDAISKSKTKL